MPITSHVLQLIRTFLVRGRDLLGAPLRQARLVRRFPGCVIHPGAAVDEASRLGCHNVLFRNAAVIQSTLGDHSFVQQNSVVCNATVGKFCSIAMNVVVGLGRHPTAAVSSHPAFYSASQPLATTFVADDSFPPFRRTQIGHDVWIGHGALIRDGVRIGTGAIIGAGAVITKDVPEYAIVVGVPGRVAKFRFDEALRRHLLASEWWNRPDDWLRAHAGLFSAPEQLLAALRTDFPD